MDETAGTTTYFQTAGSINTQRVLQLVEERIRKTDIQTILAATTSGSTGAAAAELYKDCKVVVVTHSAGFKGPDLQELTPENRQRIERAGAQVLTATHAFGGVNRAIRRKLNTYQVDEVIAFTLRSFCEGMKVCAEIALMAADAGLIRVEKPLITIAGTGSGADTAVILQPANAQSFFDLRFLEIICMPAPKHPLFA